MDFELPADLEEYLVELDDFIEREIKPLEQENDNIRFFDHRREDARTDWDRGGLPERGVGGRCCARRAGGPTPPATTATPFPKEYGGQDGTNLGMAVIREHLAAQGPRPAQRPAERALDRRQQRRPAADEQLRHRRAEGGVDAAHDRGTAAASRSASPSRTTAPTPRTWRPPPYRDGDEWVINGEKTWNTGIHNAHHDLIFARTSGEPGDGHGHHRVPRADRHARASRSSSSCGRSTCRPTTPTIRLTDVRVPDVAIFGGEGRGLQVVQHFFNENRIRQAASSLGAAQFCIDESVEYAKRAQAVRQAAGDEPGRSSSRSSSCRRSARCCAR